MPYEANPDRFLLSAGFVLCQSRLRGSLRAGLEGAGRRAAYARRCERPRVARFERFASDQFPQPRLENAIAEIAPGGMFEGFTWAKEQDVRAFAESAGIHTSVSDITINQVPITGLIQLLEPTLQSSGVLRSIGLIDEIQTSHPSLPPFDGAGFLLNFNPTTGGGYAGLFFHLSDDLLRPSSNGLMLYRVVPEPATAVLLLASTFLLLSSRNCRP